MEVSVKPAAADAVLSGFIGKWPAELGGQPALWIPGSSISEARLAGAAGQKTISDSRSLVTSPVLLAVRPELTQALANQTGNIARLADQPKCVVGLNMPTWDHCDSRCRATAPGTPRFWPAKPWRPHRHPLARPLPRHWCGPHPVEWTTQTGGQLAGRGDEHAAQAAMWRLRRCMPS